MRAGMGQALPQDGRCDAPDRACRCGEVAERSKALDWNSSKLFTGFRGFESHPLRQLDRQPRNAAAGRSHCYRSQR